MCIKHVQFYDCPSESGREQSKRHRVKANILCSHVFPCPASQWERRISRYDFMCPSCSGESPAVPRSTPVSDEWARDEFQDDAWAQGYLSEYCHSVLLWVRSEWDAGDATAREMAESWFSSFYMERRCKENDHRVGACRCDANGPLAYLYNPATAARRHLTDAAADKFEKDPRVQSPTMQNAFANRHMALSAICREQNLHFTDGISRQPFFSERAIARRRRILKKSLDDASRTAQDLVLRNAESAGSHGGWTDAHTLEMAHVSRRASLVNFMGAVLLYDNGVSNSRFSLAASWLTHIIQAPAWRTPSKIESLERLARIATAADQASMTDKPFTGLVRLVQKYYSDKRTEWNAHAMRYKARRSLFDAVTRPVHAGRDLRSPDGWAVCPLCKVGYHAPCADMEEHSHPGVEMSDHGEPGVQMKHCRCMFGRRCLFRWMTATNAAASEAQCPSCGNQFPPVKYQLVEASAGYSIRSDGTGGL